MVIPAFNEAGRLPQSLRLVREFLDDWGQSYEILVVDDGSGDETGERARAAGGPGVIVLRNERNRGKGYSVRRGMLESRGRRRLMTDADLSTPIEELPRLLARLDEGFGVAIGSRALPEARVEVRQSFYRENMGRLFNLIARLLVLPGLRDTQCGFKVFTAAAAKDAFSLSRLDGFAFDVETLFLAQKRGHRVAEVPVTWRNDAATRVTLLGGLFAFLDLARIRTNDWAGRYQGL